MSQLVARCQRYTRRTPVDVYLIDGTYELFRHFYAVPSARDRDGREVGAVRGVLASLLGMMTVHATHIGVATDHVIESFRNRLWAGYKTGEGIDPDLFVQFPLLEETLTALGVTVWPMVGIRGRRCARGGRGGEGGRDPRVERVLICTPDKDLAQSVRGTRVVQMDRRARTIRDEAGVVAKFGVMPASIPDYLALVGDSSPTAFRGCPAGAPNRRPRCWRSTGTWNRFRPTGRRGA